MKTKVYVGCSLTQAPDAFKEDVERLKDRLRNDFEVLDFIGLARGSPADIYHWDIEHCLGGCDVFVAICDYPAIGLGYELGTAVEKHGKRVLAVAHEESKVTRLLQGIDHPLFYFRRYHDILQVADFVRELVGQQAA